ncbi:hypothetical protein J19TS2_10130 [Cohnella xylanilytica]|uniref:Tetratricopeptide repeat protein n=1 Tax=Cohnella xylanilytica TaxID=557555 RepID=A0A841U5N3_9BACL|nr:tetratricopeptide repeat protein [Cohnella xylanilytica]MBB6693603.1 tetratricopeptide repeat protein [Cohnella xylanilytica]GIO11458.1 hypothetical protein J19TS2_10130 [Cohnella xylanilytica]
MRIPMPLARWMAARYRKRGKAERSLAWYAAIGENRMTPAQRLEYAELLHELGRPERALRALDGLELPDAYARRALIHHDAGREREAIDDLSEAIRLAPASGYYRYSRAVSLSGIGRFEEAIADMKEAIARSADGQRVSAQYELGCIFLRADRYEEAAETLGLAAASPDYALPLYRFRHAQALEGAGSDAEALEAIRLAAAAQSRLRQTRDQGETFIRERTGYSETAVRTLMAIIDSECGFRLKEAQLLEKAGRREEALEAIESGLLDYPDEEDLLLRSGALNRELGRLEASADVLETVRSRNPDRLAAYMELGATYRKMERWPEAIEALREAIGRFPNQTVARFWLVDVFRDAGMAAEAKAASKELTEIEPDDPLNWKQKAELAIDAGRFDEADAAYSAALSLEDSAEYYLRRSYSRFMAERYEDALLDLNQALERDESLRGESKTAYAMAELYAGMGNRELAEEEYGRAIRLEPDNAHLYERRAQCRFDGGRLDEALEDCRAGLALDSANVRLIWLSSFIHWSRGDAEEALSGALDYVRLMPEDEQGHYNLALIYSRMGLQDDAIRSLGRALELSPFEPRLYLERASIYYHHLFDRTRAAEDLAHWLLYTGTERPEDDRLGRLAELEGFDDEMRERAKEKFLGGFGLSRYLS